VEITLASRGEVPRKEKACDNNNNNNNNTNNNNNNNNIGSRSI
jgi:hypothetical protein